MGLKSQSVLKKRKKERKRKKKRVYHGRTQLQKELHIKPINITAADTI